jgi:hypothetical protein
VTIIDILQLHVLIGLQVYSLFIWRLACVNKRKYRVIEKMDGIWNRYNLKRTRRIYTFGILKCSETFKVLDLPQYISIKIDLNLNSRGAHPRHGNHKWVTLRRWGDVHAGGESCARAGEGVAWEQ